MGKCQAGASARVSPLYGGSDDPVLERIHKAAKLSGHHSRVTPERQQGSATQRVLEYTYAGGVVG